ncbi:hypothetical protein [Mesobacillus subterraneus]|uniref:Chemotaxis methyl-accepting receptor HlyB-like 4HB MCP domain-containing protein n=1 Tax=Mesobacillus subterraneus TaxID=285983 RepID=A0A3R9FIH9_9BACI|nr:hypothetical protein [Mesobacillus subterraneus]RSD28828.1 hypothetical protein EJA10_04455 [Mesobacillus subterraneus]
MFEKNKKYIYIATIAVLLIVIVYQNNRFSDLKTAVGSGYFRDVRSAIFLLEQDGDVDFWVQTLKQAEGQITLERHLSEMTLLGRKFMEMDGKILLIGEQLNLLADQYRELAVNIHNGMSYDHNAEEIIRNSSFLQKVLKEAEAISGENGKKYYQEFTNTDSETSNLVWKEYKKFVEEAEE